MNESINYVRINQTLKDYPKLFELFGEISKIKSIYCYPYNDKNVEYEYNFYGVLNTYDLDFKEVLAKLNNFCKKFENVYSNKQLKDGISNNVFSFLSELEFANFCHIKGIEILETEPKLATGKRLDFKIKTDNKQIFIEVITPRMKHNRRI